MSDQDEHDEVEKRLYVALVYDKATRRWYVPSRFGPVGAAKRGSAPEEPYGFPCPDEYDEYDE